MKFNDTTIKTLSIEVEELASEEQWVAFTMLFWSISTMDAQSAITIHLPSHTLTEIEDRLRTSNQDKEVLSHTELENLIQLFREAFDNEYIFVEFWIE